MNWKKITEQVVTVVLSMVLTAFGAAVAWGVSTTLQHERKLIHKEVEIKNLKEEAERARKRDRELITLLAEEIKKLQAAVDEMSEQLAKEPTPAPFRPLPLLPEKPENKPKIKKDEYERILRDKFEQRIQQQAPPNMPKPSEEP